MSDIMYVQVQQYNDGDIHAYSAFNFYTWLKWNNEGMPDYIVSSNSYISNWQAERQAYEQGTIWEDIEARETIYVQV